MLRSLLLHYLMFCILQCSAGTIVVKNIDELNTANQKTVPGDIVVLQNGEWKDVIIKLNCKGTKEKPIIFKAQVPGKVLITGNSSLKIGGEYIVVDGLYFKNGYSGKDDVIEFRIDNKQLANNCRITNTVVNDFNNLKRVDENSWVAFYGKNNRIDHCSFIHKKNLGVLLAVFLDDDRSRENFHSIDHNYFGKRLPLASNGGEIIRIGLAQHCQFNSNTQIKNNFFEECDGETEIISIKSGKNVVEANVFKECQGSVVFRHGDNNLVKDNYFLGNDKTGTGGVRIINKGQTVSNNLFYKCRGVDFRSPLVIMNGVPNSPPTRYVQVSNANITNNVFYECSPISLCEGSDSERTMIPVDVTISSNTFYNTKDGIIYKTYDDIKGIKFTYNKISNNIEQSLPEGFIQTSFSDPKMNLASTIQNKARIEGEIFHNAGAYWFDKHSKAITKKTVFVNCTTSKEIYKQFENKEEITIKLSGANYFFSKPMIISKRVRFTGDGLEVKFSSSAISSLFIITGNGNLSFNSINVDGKDIKANHFISSDSTGPSNHYNFSIENSTIKNLNKENGCQDLFHAYKSMIADSIVIRNSQFINNSCDLFMMNDEKEDKGYYNAEKIFIGHNQFTNQSGSLLDIYRGGSDESTLGPYLSFSHNILKGCIYTDPLIKLTGVQLTDIFSNEFSNCNPSGGLISYSDKVKARHYLGKNKYSNSGRIGKNKYVFGYEAGN